MNTQDFSFFMSEIKCILFDIGGVLADWHCLGLFQKFQNDFNFLKI